LSSAGLNGAHREVFFGGWSPLSLIFYGVERFGKILFIVERYESWKYFQCLLKTVLTSGMSFNSSYFVERYGNIFTECLLKTF
jgi:hypothetical protein